LTVTVRLWFCNIFCIDILFNKKSFKIPNR
jgi:hypothetical protein